MERLRQLLKFVQSQLGLLSVSQRVAIALCAVLAGASILWLLQWSTTPEMVPVLSHNFSTEELNTAEEALRANGIPYRVTGPRIYVATPMRYNALRVLNAGNALPTGSLFDMQSMVTDDNPFQAPEAREYAQNYARGNELARIIATYPDVQKASVLINPSTKRRIGGPQDVPTASVTVTLQQGKELTYDMVEALARLVSGAVAGLRPYNVTIIDGRTIRSFTVPRPDEAGSVEHFRMVQKLEERLLQKVRAKLADIPGVLASVTVELDTSRRVRMTNVHDAPQPRTETQQSSENSAAETPSEAGVLANVGQAVTASAGGSRQVTEESMVENFEPKLRETETVEQGPTVKKVTAAVGIPRSFVVSVFRANYPDGPDPKDDDPKFQALRDEHVARVRASVEKIVMARSSGDVQVDVYPDVEWSQGGPSWQRSPMGLAATPGGSSPMNWPELFRGFGPQAGLALLAFVGLLMMLRVVKKTTDAVASMPIPQGVELPSANEPLLAVESAPVGQAAPTDAYLEGREVDDDALRFVELTNEVSKMVEEDPKGAAELLRRWLNEY
jgi:flagellar biosynthesis/type III secretory pathway M-ring protein FliF/YscJ